MIRWFLLISVVACGTEPAPVNPTPVAPKAAPSSPPGADPHARSNPHADRATPPPRAATASPTQGKVLETMDSGGYTYARLDACGTDTWVAGPKTSIAIGDVLKIEGSMPMHSFHSSSLDRTFDTILFARGLSVSKAPLDCSSSSDAPKAGFIPLPTRPKAAPGGMRQGKILETMESGGYRYAKVDFCGSIAWIAGPSVSLNVGQTGAAGSGAKMHGFHSSTLNRTFDAIDFVSAIKVVQGEPACK